MSSLKRKPLVVVTRRLPDAVETRMRELFDTRLNHDDAPLPQEALSAAIALGESEGLDGHARSVSIRLNL